MNYSKRNLQVSVLLNAALEPITIGAALAAPLLTSLALRSLELDYSLAVATGSFLATFTSATLLQVKSKSKIYGDIYFESLHNSQMNTLKVKISNLEGNKLALQSEQLVRMYWSLRQSGELPIQRINVLADITEKYFSIMVSSLTLLSKLPNNSVEIKIEEKKLIALSSAYKGALISECVAQTSAANSSAHSSLINKLEMLTFSNDKMSEIS